MSDPETRCLDRDWFYPFRLASGRVTRTYVSAEVAKIHDTRLQMLQAAVQAHFGADASGRSAVDLACHEGWFSQQVSALGFAPVLGLDAREQHVADARLAAQACGAKHSLVFRQQDVHAITAGEHGQFDLVLCLGLIYHLENPVGALRVARALTRAGGLCLVETQVAPGLSGHIDYGHHTFVKPVTGSFAIVDETDETHGPETSTTGICLVPSLDALLWILRKVGFARVELLPVPDDGYEQLRHHKRVMVAAYA
ncbi:class I SAM-dependent methyltransferase [Arenimonas sp. MALMAid1274]|uniref:class I SAM-dependent methyltransferase n=1 Tax=Arenimonas sp. MALMAid1274 TaxID=3411630 RepID=UPI003B9E09FE